jgi:two-component system sensor histidine kinase/response regulator
MTDRPTPADHSLQSRIQELEAQLADRQSQIDRLTTSEAKFRAIAEHASDMICLVDPSGQITYVSPTVQETIGYTPAEMEGQGFGGLIHPEDLPHCSRTLQQVRETRQPCSGLEYRVLHKQGHYVWQRTSLSAYQDEAGQLVLIAIGRDITDYKRSEETLRESKIQLDRILDTTSALIANYRVYADRRFIPDYFSLGSLQLWGFAPEAILENPQLYQDRIEPGDFQGFLEEEYDYIFNEKPYTTEYRYHYPDGSLRWIQFSLRSYRDEKEDCWRCTTLSIDITDRKRAEEALRHSESRLNRILDRAAASIADYRVYADRRFISDYFSSGSQQLWGYNPEDLLANPQLYLTHFDPEDLQTIFAESYDYIFSERPYKYEYRYHHPDGTLRWIELNVNSYWHEAENCWRTTTISIDITDRKRTEENLKERARLAALTADIGIVITEENTLQGILQRCAEALCQYVEAAFARIWMLNDQENVLELQASAGLYTHLDGRHRRIPVGEQKIGRIAQHAQPHLTNDVLADPNIQDPEWARREGMVAFAGYPLIIDEQVIGVMAVFARHPLFHPTLEAMQAIAKQIALGIRRKQTEAALRTALADAKAANRAKSIFLANMSHELRTPLNIILGFTQLMERENALSDRQRQFITTINRSGEHLLNLINDVLEMSKIEAGRITLNPESFNLRHLLESLQEMFRIRAEAKKLSFTFQFSSNLPTAIVADEGKLRQILINLLSNAIKFTAQGHITLAVNWERESGEILYFTITDTGIGIAPEEMERLFQPFVQTASGLQVKEGTGLGLAISRQFVQLMGGSIDLHSVVGQGSTFTVQIPVTLSSTTPALPDRPQQVLGLAPGQQTYRLLIVDDRPDNCALLTHLLQSFGFETRTANDGQEAIAQWQVWHPHLIWMDMRMPVLDGYEATRRIRAIEQERGSGERGVKIIALTASAFEEQKATVLAAGCDDFVRKPFRERMIFDKLTEHLGVQFLYAERLEDETATNKKSENSFAIAQVMPLEWIENLRQAAIEIDDERLMQLIVEIPPQQIKLAEHLAYLVKRFDFDEILELTMENSDA